jgi:hypothetical protein
MLTAHADLTTRCRAAGACGSPAAHRLGETHPQRPAWVRAYLEPLLAGQTDAVITALEGEGKDPVCTSTQRQALYHTVGYYRRNRLYIHYDE